MHNTAERLESRVRLAFTRITDAFGVASDGLIKFKTILRESDNETGSVAGEIVDLMEGAVRADGTIPIKLISPGWGSSGYYAPEVLERDGPRVFPAGTHMFWDHRTDEEMRSKPEGSLAKLAATLASGATWQENGSDGAGLYADAFVYPSYRQDVEAMAENIGVSIHASGFHELGEAEGRRGRIITSLTHGHSVDFVTRAGRGGKILESFREAALPATFEEAHNTAEWLESRIHLAFTQIADDMFGEGKLSREERITLSSGIGAALDAFRAAVESGAGQLYQRGRWEGPSLAAPAIEGDNEIEEAEMAQELEDRLAALEAENAKLLAAQRRAEARAIVAEALAGHDLANAVRERIRGRLDGGVVVEAAQAEVLDETALREAVTAAVEAERAYIASVAPQGAAISGMGGGAGLNESKKDVPGAASAETRTAQYMAIGMSEAAAKAAAQVA